MKKAKRTHEFNNGNIIIIEDKYLLEKFIF